MLRPVTKATALVAVTVWLLCAATFVVAQAPPHEGFEGTDVSWREAGGDAGCRVFEHRRTRLYAHGGQSCEELRYSASWGSSIYLSHEVPHALVLNELSPSVWVKSSKAGMQLLARVVLPHARDPQTGGPLTTLITASQTYDQPGDWQQLRLDDIPKLLSRQLRAMRLQLSIAIDSREAFVDSILLNAYGGRGHTVLAIDDLEVAGFVERQSAAEITLATHTAPAGARDVEPTGERDIRLRASLLLIDGRPAFPRCIQYNGEPLKFLQGLGFNAVQTSTTPDAELLNEAERLGLWLISPPPTSGDIGPAYAPVLAWDLGEKLAGGDLSSTIALAKRTRAVDRSGSRLLLCAPKTEVRAYSRHVDVLVNERAPLASSLELTDFRTWAQTWPQQARPGTPVWAAIQTELAPEVERQIAAFLGPDKVPGVEPESLRLLVHAAVAAGSRGLMFRSRSRLDATDAVARRRAVQLEMINLELDLLEPWSAAGSFVTMAASGDPLIWGAVIQTDKARLLLPIHSAAGSQYTTRQAAGVVTFVVPGVPESHEAYELTPAGIRPLRQKRRVAGGILMTVDDFSLTSMIVMTTDPTVVSVLSRRLATMNKRAAELQRELASINIDEAGSLAQRLATQSGTQVVLSAIGSARQALAECDQSLASSDYKVAFTSALRSSATTRGIKRTYWERAANSLGSPVASPLAATCSTIPDHWNFVRYVRESSLGANRLAGGDFENLAAMLNAGWQHYQHPRADVESAVELSPDDPHDGSFSLKLRATASGEGPAPTLLETAPMWVTTAPVPIEAGHVLCIRGQVRVTSPITASVDGLLIFDSLGGEALAQRVGQTSGWREFVLYRAVPASENVTVTFAMTGLGEAWVDDVTVQTLEPGTHAASAAR